MSNKFKLRHYRADCCVTCDHLRLKHVGDGCSVCSIGFNRICKGAFYDNKPESGVSLSLLICDFGDCCVIRVEQGTFDASKLVFPSDNWVQGETNILHTSFENIRQKLDASTEPPVPRIERADDEEGNYLLFNKSWNVLSPAIYNALSKIAGHELPIYSPSSSWTDLLPHPEVGIGWALPIGIWRFTK